MIDGGRFFQRGFGMSRFFRGSTLCVTLILGVAPWTAAAEPEAPAASEATESPKFLRLTRDDDGELQAMETAIVHYSASLDAEPTEGPLPEGVEVDLIGAVHVGERSYYDELNRQFEGYDVVLYELVAPEGTRVPKGGGGRSAHPVGMLQDGLKRVLGLEHQLECVDYQKPNFVHADMSPEQFADSMRDRNENFFTMFFRMMGHSMAQQSSGAAQELSLFDMLRAMRDPKQSYVIKRVMAEQFGNLEGLSDALSGEEGSTILTERNKVALETLREQIEKGHKKIGIFYGAAHLPDMEERLASDFGLKRQGESWVEAWNLRAKPRRAADESSDPKGTPNPPRPKQKKKSKAIQVRFAV